MDKLGIDTTLLLTQAVNFTIMMVILTKFLYKPILKMIKARQEKIEEGLRLSRTMQEEKENLTRERARVLVHAEKEAQEILEQVKKDANVKKDAIISEGHEEVVRLKKRLQDETEAERMRMRKDMTKEAVELAEGMTRQVVGSVLSTKAQHQIIARQLAQLVKTYEKAA